MSDQHARFNGLLGRLVLHMKLTFEEVVFLREHGEDCELCFVKFYKDVSWEDLAKDPRTKSLVDSFAARLRKEPASVKPSKRAVLPAHTVLLIKLRELVEKYRRQIQDLASNEVEIATTTVCMRLLVNVLWEMVIPEKERELVVRAIEEISNSVGDNEQSQVKMMLEKLAYALKEE